MYIYTHIRSHTHTTKNGTNLIPSYTYTRIPTRACAHTHAHTHTHTLQVPHDGNDMGRREFFLFGGEYYDGRKVSMYICIHDM
jgi:hypothetical protein